jgi:hypothetical protein
VTACARPTAPAPVSAFQGASWGAPGAVSACPDDASQAAVRPRLGNGGGTLTPSHELPPSTPSVTEAQRETSVAAVTVSRWRLKHGIAQLLRPEGEGEKGPGVCMCGTAGFQSDAVSLTRREADSRPGVKGVFFCDSSWLCPTCGVRRAAERAERVDEVLQAVRARKGACAFVTLTIGHKKGESLQGLKTLVDQACRKARQGAPWARAKEKHAVAGVLVTPEVTYGQHGWHYHLHILLPLLPREGESRIPPKEVGKRVRAAGHWLRDRYLSYVAKAGGRALTQAQDVRAVFSLPDLPGYLTKGSAAWEVSGGGTTKEGKKGATPWDLAMRATEGDHLAAQLFREYAAVMPGSRACVVTAAMAAKLGIAAHDDAEAPGEVEDDDGVTVITSFGRDRWHRLLRRGCAPDLLQAVARGATGPQVQDLAAEMLGEPPPGIPDPNPPVPMAIHMSALDVAREARLEKARLSTRVSLGGALQVALDRLRREADARGRPLVLPDLKTVMWCLTRGPE